MSQAQIEKSEKCDYCDKEMDIIIPYIRTRDMKEFMMRFCKECHDYTAKMILKKERESHSGNGIKK